MIHHNTSSYIITTCHISYIRYQISNLIYVHLYTYPVYQIYIYIYINILESYFYLFMYFSTVIPTTPATSEQHLGASHLGAAQDSQEEHQGPGPCCLSLRNDPGWNWLELVTHLHRYAVNILKDIYIKSFRNSHNIN